MSSKHVLTIGATEQLEKAFNGVHLKGWSQPRIAMVGRSNVGKSTLLNALLKSRLAQTSKEPGKTRALHFYLWEEAKKILVDLPGYGFAKTSAQERKRWAEFINAYFAAETRLDRAVVLLDARHGPTPLDLQAIQFLSFENIPVTFVFTKFDQLKTQSERARRRKEAFQKLHELGYSPEDAFWVSATNKTGLRELEKALQAGEPDESESNENA